MSTEDITEILDYTVHECPRCGKKHDYKLKALVRAESTEEIAIFGGTGGKSEILFECPDTKRKFTQVVPNPQNREIISLATESDIKDSISTPPKTLLQAAESDFAEWIKNSRSVSIDFCKIMLTLSTGAIPIYFTMLKYMGFENISNITFAKIGILPPIMFLVAAVLFVLALRPRFETISQSEFATFRSSRLKQMNQFINAGALTFGGAIAFTIMLFFSLLT